MKCSGWIYERVLSSLLSARSLLKGSARKKIRCMDSVGVGSGVQLTAVMTERLWT